MYFHRCSLEATWHEELILGRWVGQRNVQHPRVESWSQGVRERQSDPDTKIVHALYLLDVKTNTNSAPNGTDFVKEYPPRRAIHSVTTNSRSKVSVIGRGSS